MSDAPQGAGWWEASDGRWYPPESRLPPPPPAVGAPAKGRSGWAIAAIVVGIAMLAMVVLAVLSIIAITFLGRSTSDKLSNLGDDVESAPVLGVRSVD